MAPTGTIDASGATGGAIALTANGSVTLNPGAVLTVRGQNYNDAGQGGTIDLEAGSFTTGTAPPAVMARETDGLFAAGTPVVNIEAGSMIDLSVVNDHALQLNPAGNGSIKAPADVGIYFPAGTPGNDQVSFASGGTITSASGSSTAFSATPSLRSRRRWLLAAR